MPVYSFAGGHQKKLAIIISSFLVLSLIRTFTYRTIVKFFSAFNKFSIAEANRPAALVRFFMENDNDWTLIDSVPSGKCKRDLDSRAPECRIRAAFYSYRRLQRNEMKRLGAIGKFAVLYPKKERRASPSLVGRKFRQRRRTCAISAYRFLLRTVR